MIIKGEELNDKYKWLFLDSLPCHTGRVWKFKELIKSPDFKPLSFLNKDLSKHACRDYFLGRHNDFSYENAMRDSKWFEHMYVPYEIIFEHNRKDIGDLTNLYITKEFIHRFYLFPIELYEKSLSKRQRKRLKDFDICDPSKLKINDIIYYHGNFAVGVDLK